MGIQNGLFVFGTWTINFFPYFFERVIAIVVDVFFFALTPIIIISS